MMTPSQFWAKLAALLRPRPLRPTALSSGTGPNLMGPTGGSVRADPAIAPYLNDPHPYRGREDLLANAAAPKPRSVDWRAVADLTEAGLYPEAVVLICGPRTWEGR